MTRERLKEQRKKQHQQLHGQEAKTEKIRAKSVAISPFAHHVLLNMTHVRKIKIRPDKTVPPETPSSTGHEKKILSRTLIPRSDAANVSVCEFYCRYHAHNSGSTVKD